MPFILRDAASRLLRMRPGRSKAPRFYPRRTLDPPSTGSVTPVMKLASSEARNSAALATSQPVPIFWRSGTLAVALGLDLGAALLEFAGAGIDRHRRVHQAGQDDVGADAVLARSGRRAAR